MLSLAPTVQKIIPGCLESNRKNDDEKHLARATTGYIGCGNQCSDYPRQKN
jgi:hypothetical protein